MNLQISGFLNPDRILLRRTASLLTFFGAFVVYLLTLEPDASFWDCPEYLVTAARMEIGHPPGNPFWTLTARIFSLFGGSDPRGIAIAVNMSSALFTALACSILTSSLFILLSILPRKSRKRLSPLPIFLSSLSAGLIFAWSDSPWFSAVEAEVYAFSLFLTALTFRLMLGWALMKNREKARRQLLLIIYLLGLSIGVHQLNLLVIPALSLIMLFHYHRNRVGPGKFTLAIVISFAIVGFILLVMMPGVIVVAEGIELLAVNRFHLPFHSGVIIFWALAVIICWGLPIIFQYLPGIPRYVIMMAWIPALLLTGYSSYMLLLIRSAASPAMNEGAPENIFALHSYLGREQYGSTPLFYGRTPYSRPMRIEGFKNDSTPDYSTIARETRSRLFAPDTLYSTSRNRYVNYGTSSKVILTPELNMWFPRLTSSNSQDIECYADWAGMTPQTMKPVSISFAFDSLGNPVGKLNRDGSRTQEMEMRPTYIQNLRYLLGYQISYMYLRYLMWNFSGRQNDRFATGEVENGNFITGFPIIDNAMLGDQNYMPDEIGNSNRGRNRYFLLPLILGITGIFWLQNKGRRGERINSVILFLFLMTGLAIVVYLNQSPREPRERDYSFLGSFWAYSLWIGAGIYALLTLRISHKKPLLNKIFKGVAISLALFVPIWMLAENYDDHDRSGRQGVTDYATNLLESLEPEAILFTNGDNYTFPLWWAQEIVGIRRDVTIINTAYLTTPWYVRQLMIPGEGRAGLKMEMNPNLLPYGLLKTTFYTATPEFPGALDSLNAKDVTEALRRRYAEGEKGRLPAMLRIPIPGSGDSVYIRSSAVASASSYINLRQLAALDIITSNACAEKPRPVYWQSSLSSSDYAGFYPYTSRALHSRRLMYGQDSVKLNNLLDFDLSKARSTLSGIRTGYEDRGIYADASFGPMITGQRLGLLRLGGRLLKAGRPADALEVAHIVRSRFPEKIWEFQLFIESDSACREGSDLARLLMESARRLPQPDTTAYTEGLTILRRERDRFAQWNKYRESLPVRYKNVMSPKNKMKSRMLPYIDSLLRVYEKPIEKL